MYVVRYCIITVPLSLSTIIIDTALRRLMNILVATCFLVADILFALKMHDTRLTDIQLLVKKLSDLNEFKN